jgi:hypothetical protein
MNTSVRYNNLSDADTGVMQQFTCWEDRVAYYIYLVGQGRIEESQKLLVESLTGKKPSTKMLERSASPGCGDKSSR